MPAAPRASTRAVGWLDRWVVIGRSTGGPQALQQLLGELPEDFGVPVLVVQHMPPHFTRSLAERLDSQCAVAVQEARPGSRLAPGLVLLAPGGFHMRVDAEGVCSPNEEEPECGMRPAVNVTLEAVAAVRAKRTVAAVLTGMGSDGTRGAQLVREAGGRVLAEANPESTDGLGCAGCRARNGRFGGCGSGWWRWQGATVAVRAYGQEETAVGRRSQACWRQAVERSARPSGVRSGAGSPAAGRERR